MSTPHARGAQHHFCGMLHPPQCGPSAHHALWEVRDHLPRGKRRSNREVAWELVMQRLTDGTRRGNSREEMSQVAATGQPSG